MGGENTAFLVAKVDLKNGTWLRKVLDGTVREAAAGLPDSTVETAQHLSEYQILGVWQILRCWLPNPTAPLSLCPPPTPCILKKLNPYVSNLLTCKDLPKVLFQGWFGQKEATGSLIIVIFHFETDLCTYMYAMPTKSEPSFILLE